MIAILISAIIIPLSVQRAEAVGSAERRDVPEKQDSREKNDSREKRESPVKKLIKFSKEKLKDTKSVTIYNKAFEKLENRKEEKKERKKYVANKEKGKKVPKKITETKEIEAAAEYASTVTGVRKEFLMGMLTVESDLGRNTGECTYKEVEEGARNSYEKGLLGERAWRTFLDRRETIKAIAEDLDYDYEKLRVSCNPASYAGTGGALGIPQFMPDTWLEYKDRLASVLGKKNPDPWDVKDGVVAMALKVSDVPGVKENNLWAERSAAKLYLSGTTSWRYDWYANLIFYWSQNYRKVMS